MNRLIPAAIALTLAGCAFADPPGDPWTVADDDPADQQPVTTPPDDPEKLADPVDPEPLSCQLEVSQFQETWWVEPHFNEFSPNEGLFIAANGYNGEGMTLAVADGATYRAYDLIGLRAVDADWNVGVFTDSEGAELRDLRTGEAHFALSGQIVGAGVSSDASRAAFVECRGEETLAHLVDPDGAVHELELADNGYCQPWGVNRNRVQFTTDGAHLVASTMSGILWAIDTETLSARRVEPHGTLNTPEVYYDTIIADMRVRPGAAEVVTTGSDGMLRRWSVPELEQIGDDIEVGATKINENTYAPHYTVSPVAFSADGQSMAFVNTDGDVVVRNAGGDELLRTPPTPEEFGSNRSPNIPVTLAFAPSGRRVGVGYYWGPAVWGCPGVPIERSGTLALDVPAVVDLAESGTTVVPIRVEGEGPIAAMRVRTAEGEEYYQAYFAEGGLMVWPRHDQPSAETIVIEADNGYATATATIQLRFIQ